MKNKSFQPGLESSPPLAEPIPLESPFKSPAQARNRDELAREPASLRQEFLLEKDRIIEEIGDLETIRLKLGLSQRRTCRLLLVDPSAWTRWLKTGAPPHVYQALKWLLDLRQIKPEAVAPRDVENRIDLLHSTTESRLKDLESVIEGLKLALIAQSATRTQALSNHIKRPRKKTTLSPYKILRTKMKKKKPSRKKAPPTKKRKAKITARKKIKSSKSKTQLRRRKSRRR